MEKFSMDLGEFDLFVATLYKHVVICYSYPRYGFVKPIY